VDYSVVSVQRERISVENRAHDCRHVMHLSYESLRITGRLPRQITTRIVAPTAA
jgi:hypothetical protein